VVVVILLAAVLVGLAAFAIARPWLGLVLLLALLPFNGLLTDVISPTLNLSSNASTMLAAWHDALAGGIIVAAAWVWARARPLRLSGLEAALAIMLLSGAISLMVAPHLLTGLYAYRTLYGPIALAVALVALARHRGLPSWVPSRAAAAIVLSGCVAALYSIWQVYVGGYSYLMTFQVRDGHLPSAYLASFVTQPRAFGTFHSPNEFGAFLALAVILVLSPALLRLSVPVRTWVAAALGFAQLLSFSRSSWVALVIATTIVVLLWPITRAGIAAFFNRLRTMKTWRTFALPVAVFALLVSWAAVSSGATNFVKGTVSGQDPSSIEHAAQLTQLLPGVSVDPAEGASGSASGSAAGSAASHAGLFGSGLGTAGPKSTRFGEVPAAGFLNSEIWYVDYVLQTGFVGLAALLVLVAVVARGLWKRRRNSLSRAALGIGAGLLVGAFFIPILDEPALAIPLWTLVGLGLTYPVTGSALLQPEAVSAQGAAWGSPASSAEGGASAAGVETT
jgi:hypothetical protein